MLFCGTAYAQNANTVSDFDELYIANDLIGSLCETEISEEKETVSRGEFITTVVKLITNNLMMKNNCLFSDVAPDTELSYCVAYAVDTGIISNAEMFYPDDPITPTAALKIAVAATGYKVKAELDGGFPIGYIRIADKTDISDGIVNIDSERSINGIEAIRILYNMLRTNIYETVTYGKNIEYRETEKTILSTIYDITELEGIVKANSNTLLTDGNQSLGDNRIRIGTKDVYCYDENNWLGYNVRAFIKNSDGDNTVVCLAPHNNKAVSFTQRDYVKLADQIFHIDVDGKEHKYKIAKSINVILNGKQADITDWNSVFNGDEINATLIDNNYDNVYECMLLNRYTYCYVDTVSFADGIITDKYSAGNIVKTQIKDRKTIMHGTYNGNDVESIDDIEPGMLLAVCISDDGLLCNISVCNEKIIGEISEMKGNEKITVDGKTINLGRYFNANNKNVSFNSRCMVLLGINGEAVIVVSQGSSGSMTGWLVGVKKDSIFDNPDVKIFTQSGKMETYKVSDKVRIDGERVSVDSFYSIVRGYDDSKRFVKFKLNKKGELINLDSSDTFGGELPFPDYSDENNNLTLCSSGVNIQYRSDSKSLQDFVSIKDAVLFFVFENEADRADDKYLIKTSEDLTNGARYTYQAFNCNEAFEAEFVVIFISQFDVGSNAVIENVCHSLDREGNVSYMVSLYNNSGEHVELYSTVDCENKIKDLKPGDVIRYCAVGDKIVRVSVEFNYENKRILNTYAETAAYNLVKGVVYSAGSNTISIIKDAVNVPAVVSSSDLQIVDNMGKIIYTDIYLNSDGTVKNAIARTQNNYNIRGAYKSGDEASFVLVQRDSYKARQIIVYNIINY